MINKIGKINSINYDGLINELKPLDREQRLKMYWRDKLYNIQLVELTKDKKICDCDDLLCGDSYSNSAEECMKISMKYIDLIKNSEKHYKLFNDRFEIKYLDDEFVAFMFSEYNGVVIPRKFVDIEFAKDYSSLPESEIIKRLTTTETSNAVSIIGDKSQNECISELNNYKEELKIAEENAKKELEEFRDEMRKKEIELREKQETMLAEFRKKVEEMKDKIFMLEMNIFALRSYFGETFSISHVMKGKNAPDDQPLVLFQKFRYMDEDLSRLSVNSEFSVEKTGIIDLFERYGELFIETFCPNSKCITFFKASRNNRVQLYEPKDDCIEEFQYYHGNQLGMIVRNGENVYLSFIDEEITLKDNLFISNSTANSETAIEIGKSKIRDPEVRVVINRKHLFIILQALLKNTNIFDSLKNEKIFESEKIIFSNADAQIQYTKYPTFKKFFSENDGSNIDKIKEGDEIFIDEPHAGSKYSQNYWGLGQGYEEHRGRGYRNTGRDADIEKGINVLNIVDKQQNGFDVTYYEGKSSGRIVTKVDNMIYRKHVYDTEEDLKKKVASGEYIDYKPHVDVEYYVSCKRDIPDWQKTRRCDGSYARVNNANLRLWSDEFMSIMWLNSNFVQQWIDCKDSGNGKDYIYFVKMLKELRDHLLKREEKEFELINKYYKLENTPWNKDFVLDFKIKHSWRRITETRAKKIAKYLEDIV